VIGHAARRGLAWKQVAPNLHSLPWHWALAGALVAFALVVARLTVSDALLDRIISGWGWLRRTLAPWDGSYVEAAGWTSP
jgi:hypothetical protein